MDLLEPNLLSGSCYYWSFYGGAGGSGVVCSLCGLAAQCLLRDFFMFCDIICFVFSGSCLAFGHFTWEEEAGCFDFL